jgi:hypothetical protein
MRGANPKPSGAAVATTTSIALSERNEAFNVRTPCSGDLTACRWRIDNVRVSAARHNALFPTPSDIAKFLRPWYKPLFSMNMDPKVSKKPEPFTTRLLSITEAPWVVTLAIGGTGWTVTRIVETIIETPSIEYNVTTTQRDSNTLSRILHIKNISRTRMFDTLEFFLGTDVGSFSNPLVSPTEPARNLGGDERFNPRLERSNLIAVFPVYQFQPGWAFDLSVEQTGVSIGTPITVSVFSGPYERKEAPGNPYSEVRGEAKTEAVRLVPTSLETFVVSNEVMILSILFLAWFLLTITFIASKLHQSVKRDPPPCTPKDAESV